MNDAMPRHPGAETMAAFVEGRLRPDEITTMTAHLRDCGECRTLVAETARYEREEERRAPRTRGWWLAAAAALILAVAAPIVIRIIESRRDPIARLASVAPRDHRVLEPRLSGFGWARLQKSRGTQKPEPDDLKLTGAAGDVLGKTRDKSDPASRHASGVAYLLTGDRADSIAALAEASRGSRDAHVWNDLAAARYANDDEHPSELNEALADVDRALALDPKLPEARFNRALILQQLGIVDRARAAWQAYLDVDPSSGWSAEAREHLRKLQTTSRRFDPGLIGTAPAEALVRDFPEETRRSTETTLLATWADMELCPDPAAAAAELGRARAIAGALARASDEHLLDETVAAIDRSGGTSRALLAQGHLFFDAGRRVFRDRRLVDAENDFVRASALFERGGSAMGNVARYYAANVALQLERSAAPRNELLRLASMNPRYRGLAAQIRWTLALDANRAGDWGAAIREADDAAARFRAIREEGNAAFVDGIAATALEMIGEPDLATKRLSRTYAAFCDGNDATRCNALLSDTATTLAAMQRTSAAVAIGGLTIESKTSEATAKALDFAKQARVLARAGDADGARQVLARARAALAGIIEPSLRAKTAAQIDIEDGTLASLDRAVALFTEQHINLMLPYAYLQRARAHRAAGDSDAASRDYAAALRVSASQERTLGDPFGFRDTTSEMVEEGIALELSRNAGEAAFAIADARHRLTSDATMTPLPPNVAQIEYAVLPKSVAIFCRTNRQLFTHSVAIDHGQLAQRIEAFAQHIVRRDDVTREAASLHRLLIEPLLPHLAGVDELVIIPDRQLYALPFAALYDEQRAQFLVEEFAIRIAPSAAGVPVPRTSPGLSLVVADPRSDGAPPLRAGRDEALQIKALHGATLLEGEEATAQRFLDLAPQSALIHYAGHANSDPATSYGALLLGGRVVGANEIAGLALTRRPLVVLAACGTFRGDPSHVAGMSSLARAFLLAGARGVVATLWEIDDEDSPPLFVEFHKSLRAGVSPARALRDAQLKMLRSGDARLRAPATWSPVVDVEND